MDTSSREPPEPTDGALPQPPPPRPRRLVSGVATAVALALIGLAAAAADGYIGGPPAGATQGAAEPHCVVTDALALPPVQAGGHVVGLDTAVGAGQDVRPTIAITVAGAHRAVDTPPVGAGTGVQDP
jgi:hypothetical protein